MITPEQQEWLDHLDDTKKINIVSWDKQAEEKFAIIKKQITNLLGNDYKVEHRGASSLKISGQEEIDIYIPVSKEEMADVIDKLSKIYGEPKSNYLFKRARFITTVLGKHIDVFVINKESDDWKNSEIFHNYLLSHPRVLEEYRLLKENLKGQSVKKYYTIKTEFINDIVLKAKL